MTDKSEMGEAEIDGLLAQASRAEIAPTGDLLARIIADADQVADQRDIQDAPLRTGRRRGLFARILSGVGGWQAMAGLVSAAIVGVSVGYASPDTFDSFTGGFVSIEDNQSLGDFMPTVTNFLVEG